MDTESDVLSKQDWLLERHPLVDTYVGKKKKVFKEVIKCATFIGPN